ncbi:hypothetical protein [Pseudomonas mediterranea]
MAWQRTTYSFLIIFAFATRALPPNRLAKPLDHLADRRVHALAGEQKCRKIPEPICSAGTKSNHLGFPPTTLEMYSRW